MNIKTCVDCKEKPGLVTYGDLSVRCKECSDRFTQYIREKRQWEASKPNRCETCFSVYYGSDAYACQACCDHEPDSSEGFHCLLCGKDCFEDVASHIMDSGEER